MSFYEDRFVHLQPIAEPCVGHRTISAREQELWDGVDREIERIKMGLEIGHYSTRRLRDKV
jgi:hypothetical protein